jgi:hypothetical protein
MLRRWLTAVVAAGLLTAAVSVSAAPSPQETFNIGVLGAFDAPTTQGVFLAVEEANAAGSVAINGTPVNLGVIAVEARTPDEVASAVTQLQDLNIIALFAPDDATLTSQSITALNGAGVPVFYSASSTTITGSDTLFRATASDAVRMSAAVRVLLEDLQQNQIAVYQGSGDVAPQVTDFVRALAENQIQPASVVLQVTERAVADSVTVLLEAPPQVIAAFGTSPQIAELYLALRANGFEGLFFTPQASDPSFIDSVPFRQRENIYGEEGWSYTYVDEASVRFTRNYVTFFGDVPTASSAAAYDAANLLLAAFGQTGAVPGLPDAIRALPETEGVQGTLRPNLGLGELSQNVVVFSTNLYGALNPIARFDGTTRIPLEPVALEPTATPTATASATFTPSATFTAPAPTATPAGVVATVLSNVLNVRTGPGTQYERIGQLRQNEQVQVVGANVDGTWLVIIFRQQQAWISSDPTLVDVFGDLRTVPIVTPPPTPTPPPATATPTLTPQADIQLVSASLNPPVPAPGQQFTLSAIIRNAGSADAGPFAVAITFQPGNVYTAVNVPGLPAGQQTTVNLVATIAESTVRSEPIVLDLNQQVAEGPGEGNNTNPFAYRIDRPFFTQGTSELAPGSGADFDGDAVPDFNHPGGSVTPSGSSALNVIGQPLDQIHYGLVSSNISGVPNGSNAIANPGVGTVIAIRTSTGRFGVIRINEYAGANIRFEYRIYS